MATTKKHAVSIVDVARVAGVSHQTVSRVLNQPESVREKTRQAVLNAIAITGYRRNENARILRSSTPETIGILVPPTDMNGPMDVMWGVERMAAKRNYLLKTSIMSERTEASGMQALNKLLGFDVAAVIIIAEQTWLEPLVRMASDLPVVSVGASLASTTSVSYVDMDQQYGVELIMDHLTKQGCQRVDHIAGPYGWYSSQSRMNGWLRFRERKSFLTGRLYRGDWSAQAGYEIGCEIAQDLPDAIVAANDAMAIGTIRALHDHGIRVPQDVLITGYDDLAVDEFLNPSLTTVHQDFHELASVALDLAVSLREHPDETPSCHLIKPKLVIRESSVRDRLTLSEDA